MLSLEGFDLIIRFPRIVSIDTNYTTAIDTNLVRVVMASVQDIIVSRYAMALCLSGMNTDTFRDLNRNLNDIIL